MYDFDVNSVRGIDFAYSIVNNKTKSKIVYNAIDMKNDMHKYTYIQKGRIKKYECSVLFGNVNLSFS
jgi:hypothetical protein